MAKELATPGTGTSQNFIDKLNGVLNTAPVTTAMIPATPATLELIGQVQTSACESAEDLSRLVTPLLVEKFKFKGDAVEELEVQVHLFLEKKCVQNDSIFAHMATLVWLEVKTPKAPLPLH